MKRLKDNSDVPEARHGTLPKTYTSSKNEATFHLPAEEWVLPAASTKETEEREFAVDSGTSAHKVSKRDFDSAELETMRTSRSPTTVMTANGEVQTREEATVYVKVVTGTLLEETLAVLLLRKFCEDHGFSNHWTSGQKPHLTKKVHRIDCNISNYVPFMVPDLSTSSSTTPTPTSSSSSSQEYLTLADTPKIQYPKEVEVRVGSFGETRCMNPQKPKTKIKMKDAKKYRAIYCMNCVIGYRSSERIWSMNVASRHFHFFS